MDKRQTYNLRYVDDGEWYRGYRTRKLGNAKAQAMWVAGATRRVVAVYGGEGAYRNEFWRTDTDTGRQPISAAEPGMSRIADDAERR